MSKYDKDKPFADPVVRCDSCNKMIRSKEAFSVGMCPECGNRRIRTVQIMSAEEQEQAKEWDIDPEFMARFEPVPEFDDGK